MNAFRDSKFYLGCLDCVAEMEAAGVEVVYAGYDAGFVHCVLEAVSGAVGEVRRFYSCGGAVRPEISVFVYSDAGAMSEAFGRELGSDQWCFVPVKGERSLVTFTAKISPDSIAQVLVHEFSHIYFSRITGCVEVGDWQQSVPLWLDEGIALNLDGRHRKNFDETVRKRLSVLKESSDYFPRLMDLYTYFNRLDDEEFGLRGAMAYAFSYFCVKELLEKFGRKHMTEFLKLPDLAENFDSLFEAQFGESLSCFNEEMTEKHGPK